MQCLTYTVPPAFDGDTLQNFLRRDCGLSWRMVVRLKQVEGGMAVDGVPRRTIDRVCAGQTVTLRLPEDTVRIEGADIPLSVVFEDDALLVVDKPPYLAVHPSAGKPEPTLANAVVAHYARQGTPLSFRPTNRLDRNTSGLLLAAKNPHVAYALTGKAYKEYLAVVLGELHGSGTVDAPIRVREGSCITREVGEGGRPASPTGRPWIPMGPSPWCASGWRPVAPIRSGCIWPISATPWPAIPSTERMRPCCPATACTAPCCGWSIPSPGNPSASKAPCRRTWRLCCAPAGCLFRNPAYLPPVIRRWQS